MCAHVAERARQRALVRRGYDAMSLAYRSDDGNAGRLSFSLPSLSFCAAGCSCSSLIRPAPTALKFSVKRPILGDSTS